MSQSHNGQSQRQCAQSKPKGKYTGERISGAKYRAIVDLAAQGRQIDRIAREVGVTWRTAKAVVTREDRQIAVRKQELLEQSLRIARRAACRLEDNIDKLPVGQLIPAYGVSVDKISLLSPLDPTPQLHIHQHLEHHDPAGEFNAMLLRLEAVVAQRKALADAQIDVSASLCDTPSNNTPIAAPVSGNVSPDPSQSANG